MDSETKALLTEFTHDLFLKRAYRDWVEGLSSYRRDHWYSVIVELDRVGAPVDELQELGSDVVRGYVFRCFGSPTFRSSGELMVFFAHAYCMWTSTVWHRTADAAR